MTVPLEIVFKNLGQSDAIEAKVRQKAAKLERFHGRITGCRVVIQQIQRRQTKGKMYQVRIDIVVPGGEVVATRDSGRNHAHEDVYVALRDSFNAAIRRLEDYMRKHTVQRVKAHPTPAQGTVARLFADEGYGFIATGDGREIYFQENSVAAGGWEVIDVGAAVRFTEAQGEKGPHAVNVTVLGVAEE